jgi:hypothetical protein
MRFIIREQEYEKLSASGRFRYEMQDRATGANESWRQTVVTGGFGFIRVDLDRRETLKAATTLFHLAQSPGHRPIRLKFRHFEQMKEINGDVQIQEGNVTLSRQINGRRYDDELKVAQGFSFWFPSTIGLSMLCKQDIKESSFTAVGLDPEEDFRLIDKTVTIKWQEKERLTVAGRSSVAQRCLIVTNEKTNAVWLDEYRWPVFFQYADGEQAIETQPVRY